MRAWPALLVFTVGCKAPVEAPAELDALSLYLFANFDGEDEVMVAGMTSLDAFLVTKDMEASATDRAVTLTPLEGENLGDVVPSPGQDPALQVSVAVWAQSRHDVTTHKGLVSDPNQVCMASDSTKYHARTFLTDLACFEDGTCPRVDTSNETRTETALADAWIDAFTDFRMIELEDGRMTMLAQGWMPQQFMADGGGNSWDQRYTIDAWIPSATDPAVTLRYYAMWSSVTLSGVGDDIYANLVKSGVDEYFENTDNWVDGEECGNDRDREYDRP